MAETMAEKSEGNKNFFQRILDSFFGGNDPEAVKKKQLKAIAKDLAKSHSNFYKLSSDEVQPALAKQFYQIYKVVAPAQTFFQTLNNPATLKNQIVTSSLSETQLNLMNEIAEPIIREKSKTIPVEQLSEEIQSQLDQFISSFDMDKVNKIDSLYKTMQQFQSFCLYDYFFFLKKFCSSIKEKDFTEMPRFDAIPSKYIKDDLKDFISVAWTLEKDADWQSLFAFFKDCRGIEPIQLRAWTTLLSKLNNLKRERTFEKLIKIAEKDPSFEQVINGQSVNVVEPFIEHIRSEALQAVSKLQTEKKKNQVDNLLTQLFGTEDVTRLKYYSEKSNPDFIKHNLPVYSYCMPLNYLKAFLLDFVKGDLRTFADLILVRGQWVSSSLSSPMSDAFNMLLEYSKKITEFDDSLAEDGAVGIKIKTLMPRTLREKDASNIASTLIEDSNNEAKDLIIKSTQNLITVGRTIKSVLEDYAKFPRAEMIINWKELEKFAEGSIKETGVDLYKKIYLFTQLMQTMLGKQS